MIKVVVDIDQNIMAINGELHSDQEAVLLKNGSKQSSLWGINIYPEVSKDSWIEFDSMINIRPRDNNKSRSVENENIQKRIVGIVNSLIQQ